MWMKRRLVMLRLSVYVCLLILMNAFEFPVSGLKTSLKSHSLSGAGSKSGDRAIEEDSFEPLGKEVRSPHGGKKIKPVVVNPSITSGLKKAIGFKDKRKEESISTSRSPITTKVLQTIQSDNVKGKKPEIINVVTTESNIDLIVGENVIRSRPLIFECSAPFPVQWTYSGDGMPRIRSNSSATETMNLRSGSRIRGVNYMATMTVGEEDLLNAMDTGKYSCQSDSLIDSSHSSVLYYFLFVPGESLYSNKHGGNVHIPFSSKVIQIPCITTHPDVLVTLHKARNNRLECSLPKSEEGSYDPRSGFRMTYFEDDEQQDHPGTEIAGSYVCIASYKGKFQMVQYDVTVGKPDKKSDLPLKITTMGGVLGFQFVDRMGQSENEEESGTFRCSRSVDCGLNEVCRRTMKSGQKFCVCKKGFIGKAPFCSKMERKHNSCESNPCGPNSICYSAEGTDYPLCKCKPNFLGRPPNCVPECNIGADCFEKNMICSNNECVDPCKGSICGKGAICAVHDHKVSCSCPPGYTGDPIIQCGKIRHPVYFSQHATQSFNPCDPWPCGPFSECLPQDNVANCKCAQNYEGTPPNCRLSCTTNKDCSAMDACLDGKCEDPCEEAKAKCKKLGGVCRTMDHKATCLCPEFAREESAPNALLVPCSESNITTDFNSSIVEVTCKKFCGKNAECEVAMDSPSMVGCTCPEGWQSPLSDPFVECYPSRAISSSNSCNLDDHCDMEQACIRKECRDPCQEHQGKCAVGAICRSISHHGVCACPSGTKGDPFEECF